MGSNLVIVAIPEEDDRVWKVSSEQVPHLTVLFLGDSDEVSNVEEIVKYVEHAATQTLRRFYLPVDHRGELGADKADVLFFKKGRYDYKAIRDFRVALLKDSNIKSAYDASPQFEAPPEVGSPGNVWIPHMTLGYPTAPAKPLDEQYGSKIYEVCFNKIAVWMGDYEGPEFLLKDQWDEMELCEVAPMDVAMSDIQHYGTKGMRWGVRKSESGAAKPARVRREEVGSGGHIKISNRSNFATISTRGQVLSGLGAVATIPSFGLGAYAPFLHPRYRAEWKAASNHNKLVREDVKWKKRIDKSKRAVDTHNAAADEINGKVAAFNSDKRWKNADGSDIDLTQNPAKQKEYDTAVERELMNPAYANAAVKVYGSNSPSGRYKFEIHDSANATLKVRDTLKEQVEHTADDEEIEIRLVLSRDVNGHILGFTLEDLEEAMADSMAQTAELGEEFLAHYGTKGMRWGVRKEDISTGAQAVNRATKKTGSGIGKAVGSAVTLGLDIQFENKTEDGRARGEVEEKAYGAFHRSDLPALKGRHGDYAKLRNRARHPFAPEAKAYRQDAKETYIKRLEEAANSMTNASGTRQYTIRERGWEKPPEGGDLPKSKLTWDVSSREIKHVAGDPISLEVIFDDEGWITGLKAAESDTSMAQSAIGIDLDVRMSELEHYGTKGMRWGVRRSEPTAATATASSKVPHGKKRKTKIETEGGENHSAASDALKVAEHRAKLRKSGAAALTNQELREVAQRMQLEQQVKQLTASGGRKFVTSLLKEQGKQQTQNLLNEQVRDFKKGRRAVTA